MSRHGCIALMAVFGLVFGGLGSISFAEAGADELLLKANESIAVAEIAVEEARAAIQSGKQQIPQIPEDSEFHEEINQMVAASSKNWKVAVAALEDAKKIAAKIEVASSSEIAHDYALLATVEAGLSLSGAKVVQTGMVFIDAVANNKTEALDIIRTAMKDSLAAASQVQLNYDRMKELIAEKYSK